MHLRRILFVLLTTPLTLPVLARTSATQTESQQSPVTASAEAPPASVNPEAWGVLAKLTGSRWQTADGVVRVFEWSDDHSQIVESELVGGLPAPARIYSMQGNELVQHECLPNHSPCIRLTERFGTVMAGDVIVFTEIVAISKKNDPSVALRERPVSDWAKWRRKYLFIAETLVEFRLVGTDELEVTKSTSSKMTSAPVDSPWGPPNLEPAISYRRAGDAAARTGDLVAADFGAMEIFVGKRMISEDLGEILEMQHGPDGTLVIQWFSLTGQAIGRYVFAAATGEGSGLELLDYPYVNSQSVKMRIKVVAWRQGGTLYFLTQPEGSGRMMTHEFSLANGKIRTVRYDTAIGTTLLGKPKVDSFSSGMRLFVPATPELIAEAVAANERRLEEERRQAQYAAEARREREAQRERGFASFMGGLTTFANTYADTMAQQQVEQARQQAFLDGVRQQAEDAERGRTVDRQAVASTEAPANAASERPRVPPPQVVQPSARPGAAAGAADAKRASTDSDANRCVSQTGVRENDTFKGNTAAYVVNGCATPVDVRICLMAESGWKCGATLGLAPQASWSYSAFHATGAVFVDARTAGSSRAFASPN